MPQVCPRPWVPGSPLIPARLCVGSGPRLGGLPGEGFSACGHLGWFRKVQGAGAQTPMPLLSAKHSAVPPTLCPEWHPSRVDRFYRETRCSPDMVVKWGAETRGAHQVHLECTGGSPRLESVGRIFRMKS